jgi:uncharacterized protein
MLPRLRRFVPTLFVALVAVTFPQRVHAQATPTGAPRDQAKVAAIRDILALTHAADQAVLFMETSLPAQRAANPAIPGVFWDRFLAQAKSRKGELEDLIIAVYDRHFSTEELRQVAAFYRTPIGQKLLKELPAITQESILAGQEWGRRIGMEVGQQLEKEGVKVP